MVKSNKAIADKYQKKTQLEHILDIPDTYIGSIEKVDCDLHVFDDNKNKIVKKKIEFIPGLQRIYEEILLNAFDQTVRENTGTNKIKVKIDSEKNEIVVENNGNGIPVILKEEEGVYIPEMIFGMLLTSGNYKKGEKRIVGGKNGYGAKLANIFSTEFTLETIDEERAKKFKMTWKDNMTKKGSAKITDTSSKGMTRITFKPDLKKFNIQKLSKDMISVMKKRVYDIAVNTNKGVSVYYNTEKVPIKKFEDYMKLYLKEGEEKKMIVDEDSNKRWAIGLYMSDDNFEQVSFVNGINTNLGGTHVDEVSKLIIKEYTEKLKKKKLKIKNSYIKEKLFVFVKSFIENPSFNSQTKEFMSSRPNKFGSKWEMNKKFSTALIKLGIMEEVTSLAEYKEQKELTKTDGKVKRKLYGIPKLEDANNAGTKKSINTRLILTEGDSAKAFAMSGLSKIGRDNYGVFPLKGKLLNVKDQTNDKILKNQEITLLKQILGLKQGHKYKSLEETRYGGIIILTDQDVDGSHIKGLVMNMFHTFWPELLKLGFVKSLITPIVKAFKGKTQKVLSFYTLSDYEKWKKTNVSGWRIKYYKGLGTSDKKEAKEALENIEDKLVTYSWNTEEDNNALVLGFSKDYADKRKEWLMDYDRDRIIEQTEKSVSINDFINKDLIHFSNYDNHRSIPSIIDGLKPTQRKILYTGLNYLTKNEIKVAQFAGLVGQKTDYHHGEASIVSTVVGMAQNYVGANNCNLFLPNGQFGCIDPETPVLLWNGDIKKAKDIKVGDKLIGDDGTDRTVEKLTEGIDDMYKILNGNMDNYIVNSHHILTLCYSGHKSIFWKDSTKRWTMNYFDDTNKKVLTKSIGIKNLTKDEAFNKINEYAKTIPDNNIFDINVQQYLKLPEHVKNHMKGIVNNKCIEWENIDLEIDPYILGSWLGDGYSDCHALSSIDSEIVKEWAIWLDKIGCEICHCNNSNNHENATYYIRRRDNYDTHAIGDKLHNSQNCKGCQTSKHISNVCDWTFNKCNTPYNCEGKNINNYNAKKLNPFKELFKKNNLFKNKHIPRQYIINSKENRLKLLAGFIDTDGSLKKQGKNYAYRLFQSRDRKYLVESLRIIAGSLGFRAKIYECKNNMLELCITGNVEQIPTKVKRKQILINNHNKNPYIHKIKVEFLKKGKFCGWNIDKNERFLLGDFTITHNTRLLGGKDRSSERYIYTNVSDITKTIFNSLDNDLLKFIDSDGQIVEPEYYVPCIPMILVNGTLGIGTGFSTEVLPHKIEDLVEYIKNKLDNKPTKTLKPWYRSFNGEIKEIDKQKYQSIGKYERDDNNCIITITELPVGTWTENYKTFIESSIIDSSKDKKQFIKNYTNHSTESKIHFELELEPKFYKKLVKKSKLDILKTLKLTSNLSETNMYLFDKENKIKKFKSAEEILDYFYDIRLEYYDLRKKKLIEILTNKVEELKNKVRFIRKVKAKQIEVLNTSNDKLNKDLEHFKFIKLKNKDDYTFDYLINMAIRTLTLENAKKMEAQYLDLTKELESLKLVDIKDMWREDLQKIVDENKRYNDELLDEILNETIEKTEKKKKRKNKK